MKKEAEGKNCFSRLEEEDETLHNLCVKLCETARFENAEKGRNEFPYREQLRLYNEIHSGNPKTSRAARNELVEATMYLGVNFMRKDFPYEGNVHDMEDRLSDCQMILTSLADKWDINICTSFPSYVVSGNWFKQIYRSQWKEISTRPQTGMQEDAKIRKKAHKFARDFKKANGEEPIKEITALFLGKGVDTVEDALHKKYYKKDVFIPLEKWMEKCIDDPDPQSFVEAEATHDVIDDEFCKELGRHLDDDTRQVMLAYTEGKASNVMEAIEVLYERTGREWTYQQVYRARDKIAGAMDYYKVGDHHKWVHENQKPGGKHVYSVLENNDKRRKTVYRKYAPMRA